MNQETQPKQSNKKWDYKWVILVTCFLAILIGLGLASGTKGLFLKPVTSANGISRTLYSFQDSIRYLTTAAVNLLLGTLVFRFGIKKLMMCGFLSLAGACTVYSVANVVWQFYIGGFLLGLGFSFVGTSMVGLVVKRWFDGAHKGKIMGAILCANGLGTALATPLIQRLIDFPETPFGYQRAYRLIAVLLFSMVLIILLLFREYPKDFVPGSGDDITAGKKTAKGTQIGAKENAPVRSPLFWLTAVMVFCSGMILQGITGVSTAHLQDVGLPESFVSIEVSTHAIALAGAKFFVGFIYDRFGLKISMLTCQVCGVIAMVSLALVTQSTAGMVLAMGYAVISSVALPIETVMVPLIAGELFEKKYYSTVLGYLVAANVLGFATGGPLLNLTSDLLGSYVPMFFVFAGIMVVQIGLLRVNLYLKKRADARAQKNAEPV